MIKTQIIKISNPWRDYIQYILKMCQRTVVEILPLFFPLINTHPVKDQKPLTYININTKKKSLER